MNIREAKLSDTEQMADLLSILNRPHYNYSDIQRIEKHIEKKHYFIVTEESEIVGAISLIENDGTLYIDTLASSKKGAGKAMIDFAISKAKEMNLSKLWCWSLENYNAIDFYKKVGFEETFLLKKHWYGENCWFVGKFIE